MTEQWRLNAPGLFYNRQEQSVVYFDSASGDTHLLGEFSAFLLQQLSSEPLDLAALIARISPTVSSVDLTELSTKIPEILQQLNALDIVEQV